MKSIDQVNAIRTERLQILNGSHDWAFWASWITGASTVALSLVGYFYLNYEYSLYFVAALLTGLCLVYTKATFSLAEKRIDIELEAQQRYLELADKFSDQTPR